MKAWLVTLLKLGWAAYLILTSLYCLLSFLPYTYYALIKAPAFEWMPWFVHHHAVLYWLGLAAVAGAHWPARQRRWFRPFCGLLAMAGIWLAVRPFMANLPSDRTAYLWSVAALLPLAVTAATDLGRYSATDGEEDASGSLLYSSAVLLAAAGSVIYAAGTHLRGYADTRSWSFHVSDFELTAWSILSHVFVAVIILSILNLIRMAAKKTSRPRTVRLVLIGFLIFGGLWTALVRFLENALSFEGWPAHLYAASLAATLTLLGFSVVSPFLPGPAGHPIAQRRRKLLLIVVAAAVGAGALALPSLIGGGDWNGILQTTFALAFWSALSVCFYGVRPRRAPYTLATILAVVLVTGFVYKGLQISAILWAKPLGSTDDDVARTMEKYAGQDVSFQLAHHVLGNRREERCGDLCRILRQYTNIRDAHTSTEVKLVDPLLPSHGDRPNIFIFVIDSLRPDYLGAYNPRVDFTPNLDAFARDSVALRNVYTQYAGTTLSEPAIWAGAMLLHAHYLQPFPKVNSLEKLARVDDYQMVVSYDTVLSQLLSPSDDMVKLDTDKALWNRFEVCSTVQQTESALDARSDKTRPVLFYAQPMNVHQFAHNDMPRLTEQNWRIRPGFNNRIAYEVHQVDECMGNFFAYLKARKLYDNSIIVLTSDHGDATGEFGRFSHSLSLYPEVLHVPLIVHLPESMRGKFVHDDSRIAALTDIAPTLYYLLGHRPIRRDPMFGQPLFAETREELDSYQRDELFVASDVRAVYGILADRGRFLYTTYDSPAQSLLFDLASDPHAERNIATDALKQQYDERIIEHLQAIAGFYGYKPSVGSLLAAATH